ncbi:MAG: hypothetical protein FWC47_02725 [Oscillospiraceae bacterium]|nr:hypothetical protein [Oscillospiraceae bacterium]
MNGISIWYYNNAIDCAKSNDITGALKALKNLPKESREDYNVKRLTSLCLMRLGYYKAAYDYAMDIEEYIDFFEDNFLAYESYIDDVIKEINLKNYRGALSIIKKNSRNSSLEYDMTGIVYFLLDDIKKAKENFFQALKIDIYNPITIKLILAINDEKELSFIYRFFKKIIRR